MFIIFLLFILLCVVFYYYIHLILGLLRSGAFTGPYDERGRGNWGSGADQALGCEVGEMMTALNIEEQVEINGAFPDSRVKVGRGGRVGCGGWTRGGSRGVVGSVSVVGQVGRGGGVGEGWRDG